MGWKVFCDWYNDVKIRRHWEWKKPLSLWPMQSHDFLLCSAIPGSSKLGPFVPGAESLVLSSFWAGLHDGGKTTYLLLSPAPSREDFVVIPSVDCWASELLLSAPLPPYVNTDLPTQWAPVPRTGFSPCSLVLSLVLLNCYCRNYSHIPNSCPRVVSRV